MINKNTVKILAVLTVIIFNCGYVYAVADPEYIQNYRDKLSVKTFFSRSFTALNYSESGAGDYRYRPNIPIAFGAGVSWGGITLTGSFGLDFLKNKDRGNTDFIDFQGYYFKRRLVLSFFIQQFKGVYYEKDIGKNILRPDIEVTRAGGYLEYIFNGNKFSYSSAFNQKEKQLRSSGSFLLGVGLYNDKVRSGKSFIPLSTEADSVKISVLQFGPSIGYVHNFIIKKHFFISGSLSVGANFAFGIADSKRLDMEVFPMLLPKAAAGYSKENWGISLTFVDNEVSILDDGRHKMSLSSGRYMLTYSMRFNFDPDMPRKYKRIFFRNPDGDKIIETVPVKPWEQ